MSSRLGILRKTVFKKGGGEEKGRKERREEERRGRRGEGIKSKS